jgi:hypothetical protein
VTPEMGLSRALADGAVHTPRSFCRMPPFKQAVRAARFAGDRMPVGARGSSRAGTSKATEVSSRREVAPRYDLAT